MEKKIVVSKPSYLREFDENIASINDLGY